MRRVNHIFTLVPACTDGERLRGDHLKLITAARPAVLLDYLKQQTALAELPLVQKGSRLSVMPVTPEQWAAVLALKP